MLVQKENKIKIHARHKLKKKILQEQAMRLCIHITQFVNNIPVVGSFLHSFPQLLYQ